MVSEAVRGPAGQSGLPGQNRLVLGKVSDLGTVQQTHLELTMGIGGVLQFEPAVAVVECQRREESMD